MNATRLRVASEVDSAVLDGFLGRVYRSDKVEFLARHGDWWYRGQDNRWVLEIDGEVVAYCGVMPTALRVAGERIVAAWWLDLVVAPEHRGEGLQSIFDDRVRASAPLVVGFPNALAAAIHRRHGWGVREDLDVRMLPLRPSGIVARRARRGATGVVERLAGVAAAPYLRWLRRRLEGFEPRYSRLIDRPRAEELAAVFAEGSNRTTTTTVRDAEYLEWRYLESPYHDELIFIVGGEDGAVEVAAVVRNKKGRGGKVARILDVFGALDRTAVVRDVLSRAAKEACAAGAVQMTAMSANHRLSEDLRSVGFVVRSRSRFCWTSGLGGLQAQIGASRLHLALGDSDNDEP